MSIIDECVAMVNPAPERRDDCVEAIEKCISALGIPERPTPAQWNELLGDYGKALDKARKLEARVAKCWPSRISRSAEFRVELEHQIRMVKGSYSKVLPHGKTPPNLIGVSTAVMARDVLKQFDRPVNHTSGGAWYGLTRTLYKAATGQDVLESTAAGWCRKAGQPILTHVSANLVLGKTTD